MGIIGVDDTKRYFRECYDEAMKHTDKVDFLEAGTYSGHSLCQYMRLFKQEEIPINHFWGCDSFTGLPKEAEGVECSEDWYEGVFNTVDLYKAYCKAGEVGQYGQNEGINFVKQDWPTDSRSDVDKVIEILSNNLRQCGDNFTLVPGYYSTSLNKELAERMSPFLYVHMDVDLYSSCVTVLDFVFQYRLAVPGMFVRYDDWHGTNEGKGGESKAHIDMSEKYDAKWRQISDGAFILEGYNHGT